MNKLLRILKINTFKTQKKIFIIHNLVIIICFTFIYRYVAKNYGSETDRKNFSNIENSFYYTTVTHFGVGYGDIVPESVVLKRTCIIHILLVFLIILY